MHTVWLFAVIMLALTSLFVTVTLPVVVQPLRIADQAKVLGPAPKPLRLGVDVVALAIAIEPAPAVFVQFHTLLPVTVLPVMSVATALRFAVLVHTVCEFATTRIELFIILIVLALLHPPRLIVHVNWLFASFNVMVAVGLVASSKLLVPVLVHKPFQPVFGTLPLKVYVLLQLLTVL